MSIYNVSILYLYACSMAQVMSILSAYHKEIWCNSNILDMNSVGGTLLKLCPVHHLSFLKLFMISSFCQGTYPFMIIIPSECHITSAVETDQLNNIVIHHALLLITVINLLIYLCFHTEMFIHVGDLESSRQ